MNKKSLSWAACLLFSLVSGLPAQAQSAYPAVPPAPPVYTQQQLDQMLAPVALYPDSLLAQVLMAATYPLEVVQAQRFVEARPGLQGDGLARAVAPMPWDPSVKALVQFPSVLAMLNDRLDWTQQMGQAFLGQQASVMDTVQNLRERARIAGTLESSPQQRVVVQDEMIEIVPVNPQVVYVPYYNPVVVYGDWWWPSAPPVVWAPPPRYRPPSYASGFSASISFGAGIGVMSAVFGDARPDWRQRQVMVSQTRINNVTNVNNVTNINNTRVVNNVTVNQRPVVWHHDARYGGGGRYARQPAPTLTPPPGPAQAQAAPSWRDRPVAGAQPRPQPVADNVQQRLAQQDQLRQRQAVEQQHQREQQANEQQRQREQMIRQQQDQREQQAREQRQQQQAQERQWQQRQQGTQQQLQHQQQMQQRQLQQQQREQQMRQQQMQNQQHEQQRQAEQGREQARQHQEQAQRQQAQQQARQQQQREQQREQHPRREERRDERT
ncbi:DUF3300 domain-containing protein [Herbaspirillum sp. AP02]|uniref:DUF3300 domain-containing protein n=1 Tax=unclassified Herbaspirillum TaxID=2624150 RepID=UPI0015D978B5|nr:DUF3300 domain-containing protein [Herbaspirillum sp. AP02]NZD68196.1 DUF3300 domain-containing protein [Herbaspirillum sp. AP21]